MWDGIENAGWETHDDNATTWNDLIGNRDGIYSKAEEIPKWTENSWESVASNDSKFFETSIPDLSNTPGSTVEIIVEKFTNARGTIFGSYNVQNSNNVNFEYATGSPNGNFRSYYWGRPDFNAPATFPLMKRKYFASIRNEDNYTISNGESIIGRATTSSRYFSASPMRIGCDGRTDSMCLNGRVYAIRLYNRALTTEEIAHNYAIDKIRFNLP